MTIERTILSVLAQTYRDIEYIIIDGNSTDATVSIIKKYQDKISIWVSEDDAGLYDAMNKGIALSTGDIVGILNADDTFFSNDVLEKVANIHKENSVDASVGDIVQFKRDGEYNRFYSSKNWRPWKLKIGMMPPHPSIFFKKRIFDRYGNYCLEYKIAADYELITRFFLKYRINWIYSDIITTAMMAGGVSNSGVSSYMIITKEIQNALKLNGVNFFGLVIHLRFLLKIQELSIFNKPRKI